MIERPLDGRSRPVCPACGHVLYHQLKVGAGSLVIEDGALLLVQRGPGAAGDFPGTAGTFPGAASAFPGAASAFPGAASAFPGAASAFPGAWCLPAGYCEPDEPPALTAVRETEEETGLQVLVTCLSGTYYFDDDPRGNGLLLVYEAQRAGGRLKTDGRETVDARFFAPGDLPTPLAGGGHDQAILTWQARALDRWDPGEPMRYCPYCTCPLEEQPAFGRMRPVCPTCGYIHFLTPKVGVSILVEQDGRVLLVRRAIEPGLGRWSLPSGFIEWDESPDVAAVREVAEETGLVVADAQLLDVAHYSEDFRGPGLNINYRASVIGGKLRPADDAAEARFFALEELPLQDEIAFESHRRLLARWRREQS